MKRFISIFLILLPTLGLAQQANFEDGFTDGDFTDNPAWAGNTGDFMITTVNDDPALAGNYLLRLNAPAAGSSYLSVPSPHMDGYWEFFVRQDFAPSNNNRTYIYLMSDIADLTGPVNGYALRTGENGTNDVFRLFRITNGVENGEILTGTTDISAGGGFRVKVTRSTTGDWLLEVAAGYDGVLAPEATGNDDFHTSAEYFGIRAIYTATRTKDFYFDFKIDVLPPVITPLGIENLSISGKNSLEILFTKTIDISTALPEKFELNPGSKHPNTVNFPDNKTAELIFADNFTGGENQIRITDISDEAGDASLADTAIVFYIFDDFEPGDVAVNEIMYDPPAGIPEYVELKNNTEKFLNLKNWKIGNDRAFAEISAVDAALLPDSFLVISRNPEALFDFFGDGSYINTLLPQLRNSGDQVRLQNENGTTVDLLQYSPSWGGTKVALERRLSTTDAAIPENWGNSPHPDGGTPGKANALEPDTTPPELVSLDLNGRDEIVLIFTKSLLKSAAENLTNYEVQSENGNFAPTSAVQFAPSSVFIKFNPPLPYNNPEHPYRMVIKNMEDVFDNKNPEITGEFNIINFGSFEPGDVVINEFMYDPPTGTPEYVELKNTTGKYLNLKNWKIGNNRSEARISAEQLILYPDSFAVLTTNPDALIDAFGTGYYHQMSLPALVNAGDQIRVFTQNSLPVDSLEYTPAWGGAKKALERIDTGLSSMIKANWENSPNPAGGTPGRANEVRPDTAAPMLLRTTVNSKTSITLVFSRFLEPAEAENPANYEITPNLPVQQITAAGEEINLVFSAPMTEGEFYMLSVRNLKNIFGYAAPVIHTDIRYLEFFPPGEQDIVINEIMYLRDESDDAQFVELFNRSTKNIAIGGWVLADAAKNKGKIPAGILLAAGEYLVLTDKAYFADGLGNGLYLPDFPSLNRTGDAVQLADDADTTIDSLYYTADWGGDKRISIERKDPFAASNDASNWAVSTHETGSTPGFENSRRQDDLTPPQIIFASSVTDGIFAAFSEFIRIENETAFYVNGVEITEYEFNPVEGNNILLRLPASPKLRTDAGELSISNLFDVKGNKTETVSREIAVPVEAGALVINEILFEPLADANDNLPDQAQYLELYNPNDFAVSLEGLVLAGPPDENGIKRIIEPVSNRFKWIPAGGYFLIYAENEASDFDGSKTAVYFDLPGSTAPFTMRVNRANLGMKTTGDAIYIADSTGVVIDSVYFARSWHNPNLITTKGTSLERINPMGPSNEADNWGSGTDSRGGTPAAQNSIYQLPGTAPGSSGLSFSSNPFSPDNDGFEDNLFINYTLDHPDYLLHVRIFDRYGRQVRTLADGKPAGFSGNLIWDGLTDDRKENRVGIYIILFEAYNSTAGKKKAYKKTVVLARKF